MSPNCAFPASKFAKRRCPRPWHGARWAYRKRLASKDSTFSRPSGRATIKEFGRSNPFGAGGWRVVTEAGVTHVPDLKAQSELRFEAPSIHLPARADSAVAGTPIAPQDGGWADATSWVCRWITNLCVAGFRSPAAAVYIVVPMAMVSALCYALMYALDIGLTPYTLPVVAVSAGIGVDYGLYLDAQYRPALRREGASATALTAAARQSMSAIIATCLTLPAGVLPSQLSGLKYQSDMGLLLTFMFVVNMLAAILVLPARLAIMTKRYAERSVTSRQAHFAFGC